MTVWVLKAVRWEPYRVEHVLKMFTTPEGAISEMNRRVDKDRHMDQKYIINQEEIEE